MVSDVAADLAAEVTARIADVDAEETRAMAAEALLQSNIDAEVSARTNADSVEQAARIAGDAAVQANVDAEVSRAEAAEASLSSDIAAEATRATAAEGVLTSATSVVPSAPSADTEGTEERRRGRNRRGRNRNRDRAENQELGLETASNEVPASESAEVIATPIVETSVSQPVAEVVAVATVSEPVATATIPEAVAPAPVASAPVEEIRVPSALPKVEFQALQPADLEPVLQSAGMVWVNTDREKHEQVKAQIAAEPIVTHPPREPKPAAELPAGPMVLIETGGKEQTIEKQN